MRYLVMIPLSHKGTSLIQPSPRGAALTSILSRKRERKQW